MRIDVLNGLMRRFEGSRNMRRLGAVLLLLACLPGVGRAQAVPDAQASLIEYNQANAALKEWFRNADADGSAPPRLSDPHAAPLLRAAFDKKVLVALEGADANAAIAICLPGTETMMSYQTLGLAKLGANPSGKGTAADAAITLMNSNAIGFQDESALGLSFSLDCWAGGLPAITQFATTLKPSDLTPVRRAGLAKMRNGILEIYVGAIRQLADRQVREPNRAMVLDTVARQAEPMAAVLRPFDRQGVIGYVNAALPTATPESKVKLEHIRSVMSNNACTGLCAIDDGEG